jgi:hypothetical protein
MADDLDDDDGDAILTNQKTGRVSEIWKATDEGWGYASARRTARRRASRHRGREFTEQWLKAKKRWDGGPDFFRKADYERAYPPARCENCKNWFLPKRSDAKTCSGKCRTALHRRHKAKVEAAATVPSESRS